MVRQVVALVVAGCNFSATQAAFDAATGDGQAPRIDGLVISDARIDAAASPPPALVQQAIGTANTTNAPLTATFPAAPASGDVLVMIGAAEHGGLASVTGGGVATWTRATRSLMNTNIEIWYGVTDGSSSAVTITFPAYTLPIWLLATEWSGLATSNVLDMAASTAGTASPAAAGAVTASAHELVIFGVGDQTPNTFGVPGGAWMPLTAVSSNATVQNVWYEVVASSTMITPAVTETHHNWDAAIATFRAR